MVITISFSSKNLYFSCCPEKLTLVRSESDVHYNHTFNDSYILCANTEKHEFEINEQWQYCPNGKWESTVLSDNGYEIRNINENLEVKYWGNKSKLAYHKSFRFKTKSSFYCVSNNTCYFIVKIKVYSNFENN